MYMRWLRMTIKIECVCMCVCVYVCVCVCVCVCLVCVCLCVCVDFCECVVVCGFVEDSARTRFFSKTFDAYELRDISCTRVREAWGAGGQIGQVG
jgi:hypothetical protein